MPARDSSGMNGSGTRPEATVANRASVPSRPWTYRPSLSWPRISSRSQSNTGKPAGLDTDTPAPAKTNSSSAATAMTLLVRQPGSRPPGCPAAPSARSRAAPIPMSVTMH
jgi:hypothetical protein